MNLSMYSSPKFYTLAMRVLYWPHFSDRYRVVADLIPQGASVVDACCGDAYIYPKYLRKKGVSYVGLDNSPAMVKAGIEAGIDVRLWDAAAEDVPEADVVLMQGALCHFIPHSDRIVEKLRTAAKELLIISEPVRPTSSPKNRVACAISKTLTQPINDHGAYRGDRFTEEALLQLFRAQPGFISSQIVPGGRDMVGVFRGRLPASPSSLRSSP